MLGGFLVSEVSWRNKGTLLERMVTECGIDLKLCTVYLCYVEAIEDVPASWCVHDEEDRYNRNQGGLLHLRQTPS